MSVITRTGARETVVVGPLKDAGGVILTGLTNVVAAVARESDKSFLDWADMTFKPNPGTLHFSLSEWSASRLPGVYYIDIDTSAITSVIANDKYAVYVCQTGSPSNAIGLPQLGEIRIGEIVDKIESNLNAPISGVPAASASAFWTTDISTFGTYAQVHTAAGALYGLKIAAFNKLVELPGNPGQIVVYRDGGIVPYAANTLLDAYGNAVAAAAGEPAQRSEATGT